MRVLIVDDDPIVVESLTTILGAQPDVEVIGSAGNGLEAVARFAELGPDIVLMDVRMPDGDGLAAGEAIMARDPDARIVYLTTFSDDDYIVRALRLGAKGYLIKQQARAIAPALREVMVGKTVLGDEVGDVGELAAASKSGPSSGTGAGSSANPKPSDEPTPLTPRERSIVDLVAEGLDNREIANELHLSEGTVRNHISTILTKLALRNRTQIAVWAWRRRPF